MAFRSDGPVTLALPPFRGVTRSIILLALVCFFALLALSFTSLAQPVFSWLVLRPEYTFFRAPWQLLTYAFVLPGLLSTLFALLSVWFFGSSLEDELGPRWLTEYFLVTVIGGALIAAALARLHVLGLTPEAITAGLWQFVIALVLAFARLHPDMPLRFNFILTLKAKYLAAIYLLVYLALALRGGDRLGATAVVCACLCGFLYLRYAPRRGFGFAGSEWWYGMRHAYYRAKRRRAAKKFTVYMRKQGKDVSIDESGRYVDPTGRPRDPNDRRWMN